MLRPVACFVLVAHWASVADAARHSYALIIGNNALPQDVSVEGLAPLRYADDDAVRYYGLFERLSAKTRLLAVLDTDTQKRYPTAVAAARAPTRANLLQAVAEYEAAIREDRRAGIDSVLYFVFSGHGYAAADGTAALALADSGISQRDLYDDVLSRLAATYVHLIVDACDAGAVVGLRGFFDKEANAQAVPLSHGQTLEIFEARSLARFPHVGAIVSTAAGQEAHEWSRIESGVFTHELLSALSGAADVNGDGNIEYTEAQAFIASANRGIKDPRAVPNVVAKPPAMRQSVPLVSLADFRDVAWLRGDAASLGHFYVELENGQRYLDANLSDPTPVAIALPGQQVSFLRASDREVELRTESHPSVDLSTLRFQPYPAASKGAIDATYRRALFGSPYSEAYYKGYVDSIGAISVAFGPSKRAPLVTPTVSSKTSWYVGAAAFAALSGVACGVATGFTLKAKHDFDDTTFERPAHAANLRFVRWRAAAVGTGLAALVSGAAAWMLWPARESTPVSVTPLLGGGVSGLAGRVSW